ncbi:MAG: GTPase Era [Clostridiales bacterium 43-6]|nr:MAG: GTPase Era [Clostridiales bacterium 43-6]
MPTKTAFIAIVGRPNVGKSSLLNTILGQKIAAVSDKPQTTRTKITGVLTKDETQLVFIDTPGLHKPRTALGKSMVKAVGDGMAEVDVCVLVVEAQQKVSPAEKELMDRFQNRKLKAILAINKIDLVKDKKEILSVILEYNSLFDFHAVVPVSATENDGLDELLDEIIFFAEESPHFFDEDTLTDQPERVLASEMIREKLLQKLEREIPHGIAVGIDKFRERDDSLLDIEATIYCEKESHKGIVIGKNGGMLKTVGSLARAELEGFFQCKINLQLWVKVKEDWRNRQGLIHNFGLDS